MREKTVVLKIYQYEELNERAKDHARHNYNGIEDFNPREHYDPECWIDMQENCIKNYEIGYYDTNPIECRFSSVKIDIDRYIARVSRSLRDQRNLYRLVNTQYSSIERDLSYLFYTAKNSHFRNVQIDFDVDLRTGSRARRIDSLVDYYREKLEEHLRDCESIVARAISNEIDHLQSEEYFADMAEANEWEFLENGDLA